MAHQSYSISSRARPAALTALPGNLRDGYVAHLHANLSADCHVLHRKKATPCGVAFLFESDVERAMGIENVERRLSGGSVMHSRP